MLSSLGNRKNFKFNLLKISWFYLIKQTFLPGQTSYCYPGVGAEDHLPHTHHLHRTRLQPADLDIEDLNMFTTTNPSKLHSNQIDF